MCKFYRQLNHLGFLVFGLFDFSDFWLFVKGKPLFENVAKTKMSCSKMRFQKHHTFILVLCSSAFMPFECVFLQNKFVLNVSDNFYENASCTIALWYHMCLHWIIKWIRKPNACFVRIMVAKQVKIWSHNIFEQQISWFG